MKPQNWQWYIYIHGHNYAAMHFFLNYVVLWGENMDGSGQVKTNSFTLWFSSTSSSFFIPFVFSLQLGSYIYYCLPPSHCPHTTLAQLLATPILAHAHHAPLQCACDACAAAITTLFQLTQRILVFPFSSFWIYMNGTFIFPMECSVVPDSFAYLIVVSTKPTSPGTSLTGCDNGISLRQLWLSYYQCSF